MAAAGGAADEATRWRLFIAAPLPAETAERLWQALAELRERHAQARWTPLAQYHATLVFLGSTAPAEVDHLARAMDQAARGTTPFRAELGHAGGRAGGRRGGVAWLKLGAGSSEVSRLSLAVDRACSAGTYVDSRPRPHVTVARRVDRRLLEDLQATPAWVGLGWTVARVVLYRSRSGVSGATYEVLHEVPLGG